MSCDNAGETIKEIDGVNKHVFFCPVISDPKSRKYYHTKNEVVCPLGAIVICQASIRATENVVVNREYLQSGKHRPSSSKDSDIYGVHMAPNHGRHGS